MPKRKNGTAANSQPAASLIAEPAPEMITICQNCGSPLVNCFSGAICPGCGQGGLHPLLTKEVDRANRRQIEASKLPECFQIAAAVNPAASSFSDVSDARCYGVVGHPGLWRRIKRKGSTKPAGNGNILAAILVKDKLRIIELARDVMLMQLVRFPADPLTAGLAALAEALRVAECLPETADLADTAKFITWIVEQVRSAPIDPSFKVTQDPAL